MRPQMKSQRCSALTKEQRQVLDEAAAHYGVEWHVRVGKHNKIYLGDQLVCVISRGRDHNSISPVRPETRLRNQIKHAMERS